MLTLRFSNFYARTLFCFVIPDIIISDKKVNSDFNRTTLYGRLSKYEPAGPLFEDFEQMKPVFAFNRQSNSGYVDKFWEPYSKILPGNTAHYPFETRYKEIFSRFIDNEGDDIDGPLRIKNYNSKIKARFYPYGAVSIQIIEFVEPEKNCTSRQIVEFLKSPILLNSNQKSVPGFLNGIKENILQRVFKSKFNRQSVEPQYYIINPKVSSLPEIDNSWDDIATLLSVSNERRHIEKYQKTKYSFNYAYDGQMMMFSDFSSLLFLTPDLTTAKTREKLKKKRRALRCIRNRVANIAELVTIQEAYVTELRPVFDKLLKENKDVEGYPLAELRKFLEDRLGKNTRIRISNLTDILTSQKYLQSTDGRWQKWYSAIKREKNDGFQGFLETLEELRKLDVKLGKDVIDSIKYILDEVNKYRDIIPGNN